MKKKVLSLALTGFVLFGGTSVFAGSLSDSIHISESVSTSAKAHIGAGTVVTTNAKCESSSNYALDVKLLKGVITIQNLHAPKGGIDKEVSTIKSSGDHHLKLDPAFTLGSGAKGSATSSWK
ncbi:MAG: hypothetical protein ACRCX2_27435 [Paraclostridium sp.]